MSNSPNPKDEPSATTDVPRLVAEITAWLIGPARKAGQPKEIVAGLIDRLVAAGVPLWRVRIGQRVANPMIGAWGVIWTRDGGAESYTVPRSMLATDSYRGSPFEHVIVTRTLFHQSLESLMEGHDHPVLFEQAAAGSTDYLAIPLEYGDGSVQASAFTTDRPGGFAAGEVALIDGLAPAIAAALEPAAMRHSMESLLEVYLGNGPAARVAKGNFQRGHMTEAEAAVLVTDMRNFTGLSERLAPDALLDRLGAYFEVVVDAVRAEGGDVLKFIGDGVLSVFPARDSGRLDACLRAARSVVRAFGDTSVTGIPFVAALHVGPVVYGNIGSRDRLDFTVVGPTVNYVSRLEGIAKLLGVKAVCSADVASMLPADMVSDLGRHALKGFSQEQRVFELSTVAGD
ncbi:adenylate/guanylate cyclase domain-containing protein [Mesorhizobium sp. LHD-90]|uniref:adenylate/guanylate cyclase domain-containing protein n=1 Tax=Mesorhizobium sp. LHD-90 TaxID=3071414 RepID=UPI0027DF8F3E|nr:adenylate/guanylate cyclase domain-containing protein [Mesorhizobium sp. LHD-90]MDQ6436903.1 adenylate/guanylate cyclase domain-containing protein [Mesorhizobium sp. LHD-90]